MQVMWTWKGIGGVQVTVDLEENQTCASHVDLEGNQTCASHVDLLFHYDVWHSANQRKRS